MSKVRVYEVAKQLNMDQKTLVALFQSMGIGDVRNHMSAVEADVVERVKRHLERQRSPEVVEERIRADGRVVKRRARGGEPEAPTESRRVVPAAAPSAPGEVVHRAPIPPAPPSSQTSMQAPASQTIPRAAPSRPADAAALRVPVGEATPASARSVPEARRSAPDYDGHVAEAALPAAAASQPASESAPTIPRAAPSAPGIAAAPPPPPSAPAAVAPPPPPSNAHAVEVAAPPPPPPPAVAEMPAIAAAAPPPSSPAPTPVRGPDRSQEVRRVSPTPPTQPVADEAAPPRRPSSPPKTGIDVWQGRPGVPMPAARAAAPPARRTTYDPRQSGANPARPGQAYGNRPGMPRQRPGGFRPRPGLTPRKPVHVSTQEMASHKKVVKIEEQVSLQQLAAKMSLKATDVLLRLLSMGMTGVNINSTLDADTAKLLAGEFGWSVEDLAVDEGTALTQAMAGAEAETEEDVEIRPPIVTVMGHVDHGKTSLLDRIRKATVAEGEAGGITQHIGAYRVETPRGVVAFLDTPGHEAFTAMRARGASVTDIVVLVVAADDGVMPQTKEAINHAQAARVPILVAVNKIDKPGADADKIKRDLASFGLQPEDWGGETMFISVSARTGEGIDQLLESILLQAEILELKANPKRRASATVIEALLDRGRGPVARVMVQDGTLHVGDVVLAGSAWGKVRAMSDELGRAVAEAGPATPVEVLGLNDVPSAGDPVHAVKDAKTAEEIAETRRKKASKSLIPQDSRVSLEALTTRLAEADQLELKLIIKGDVQGSVEAVAHALSKLTTQKVKVTIVHAAVGAITEGDVNLAVASKAVIVGFNVRPAGKAASLAEAEGVEIRLYNIIYNAIDDIRSAMEGLLPATKVEKVLGRAEVRQVFRIAKVGVVAGCMVTSGTMKRTSEARLLRDNVVVWTGRLSGLRRFKDDVKEVAEGFECGISLENFQDIKANDIVEGFEIEEIKTKL